MAFLKVLFTRSLQLNLVVILTQNLRLQDHQMES
ncbi:Uncharacterised protein [Escherichia coli]|nr:Uncharacterised protein [Escherichia coli]